MTIPLRRILRPKVMHCILYRDGRDEIIKAGDELLFFRDGRDDGSYQSLITLKPDHTNIKSTHKLKRLPKHSISIERPNIKPQNEYYKHVRTIQIVEDGSVTPKASINPKEGIIYLNPDFFSNLPWLWKVYIIFHEIAHLWMHTEPETDLWASYLYVKAGYPPSQAAMCLKYTLSDSNPEKDTRRNRAVENLLKTFKLRINHARA